MTKETILEKIIKPIEENGFKAYFVGGCVRDKLMDIEPHDFDICTDATPEELHKIFSSFSNVSENSEKFGVTMPLVEIDGVKEQIEIATFRKDKTSGRHPSITLTDSIDEDASRRDFTINALYEDSNGKVIDPTGNGIADIKAMKLRFVGSAKERITEDPLRAFRFVRFLATKGFKSAHSFAEIEIACKSISYKEEISKERRLKEIEQMFAGKWFMDDTVQKFLRSTLIAGTIGIDDVECLLSLVEQSWMWHSEGSIWEDKNGRSHYIKDKESELDADNWYPEKHGTAWEHTLYVMRNMNELCWDGLKPNYDEHKRFLLMLAAMLHDIGKGLSQLGKKTNVFKLNGKIFTEEVPKVSDHAEVGFPTAAAMCKDLGMCNDDVFFVSELVRLHMRMHQVANMKSKYKIMKMTSHPHFNELVLLAMADEGGCVKIVKDEWPGIKAALNNDFVKQCIVSEMPKPVLTGDYLIEKGEKPSPLFRKKLDKALQFQIDEGISDIEVLYKKVKGIQ